MKEEKGQAMVEYVFIIAFAIIVVIIMVTAFGGRLLEMFQNISDLF